MRYCVMMVLFSTTVYKSLYCHWCDDELLLLATAVASLCGTFNKSVH